MDSQDLHGEQAVRREELARRLTLVGTQIEALRESALYREGLAGKGNPDVSRPLDLMAELQAEYRQLANQLKERQCA